MGIFGKFFGGREGARSDFSPSLENDTEAAGGEQQIPERLQEILDSRFQLLNLDQISVALDGLASAKIAEVKDLNDGVLQVDRSRQAVSELRDMIQSAIAGKLKVKEHLPALMQGRFRNVSPAFDLRVNVHRAVREMLAENPEIEEGILAAMPAVDVKP